MDSFPETYSIMICLNRKSLDNNDLNQVWLTSGFVKTWVCWGAQSRIFKDFRLNQL